MRATETHGRVEPLRSSTRRRAGRGWADAPPGHETTTAPTEPLAPRALPTADIVEPAEGGSATLPDIVPVESMEDETDAISSALAYNPTITQAGAAPGGFGVTRPYTMGMSGITVTASGGTYRVAATVDNPIKFQVRASTGPSGQLNITGKTDSDITAANYAQVATDLTPDMSDLNGRPPRSNFWSKSLTIRHERFHCTDGRAHARTGVTQAQTWLDGQTASSVAEVNALIARVPDRVKATRRAAMTYPGREERAYGDGAASYRTLATDIKSRGDAGMYALGDFPIMTPGGPETAYA